MKKATHLRRIASNELLTPEGKVLTQHVVLLEEGFVVRTLPLDEEQAGTEWLQGRITLKQEQEGLRAYYQGKLMI
jgi:hypothetical protein